MCVGGGKGEEGGRGRRGEGEGGKEEREGGAGGERGKGGQGGTNDSEMTSELDDKLIGEDPGRGPCWWQLKNADNLFELY